jgi:hypothetical protein
MFYYSIEEFWSWFDKIQNQIGDDIYNAELIERIDEIVSNWGLGWEIGPGNKKRYSLTISPNGSSELLGKVSEVVAAAPSLENWEIFSFKQAKDNWQELLFDGNTVESNGWKYCLLVYPNNETDIEIKADNLSSYSLDSRNLIADLVITNLLGESLKMQALCNINVVDQFESLATGIDIEHLPAHLDERKSCH